MSVILQQQSFNGLKDIQLRLQDEVTRARARTHAQQTAVPVVQQQQLSHRHMYFQQSFIFFAILRPLRQPHNSNPGIPVVI